MVRVVVNEQTIDLKAVIRNINLLRRQGEELLREPNPERLRRWYEAYELVFNDSQVPEFWKKKLEELDKQLAPLFIGAAPSG
ncbi:MAG: hypothetical protein V1656_02855 [Candidatus Jorgensenbacteria bacterium]